MSNLSVEVANHLGCDDTLDLADDDALLQQLPGQVQRDVLAVHYTLSKGSESSLFERVAPHEALHREIGVD